MAQQETDNRRQYYQVNFPRDVEFSDVLNFARALSGLGGRSVWQRLNGLPTVAFEVVGDQRGISHRLGVPPQKTQYVIGQLRGKFPGIKYTPLEEPAETDWTVVEELELKNQRKPLRIPDPASLVNTLLATFQPLKEDQALLWQLVIANALPEVPRDKDEEKKNEDHLFLAAGRIAARAGTPKEAQTLLNRVFAGLATTSTIGVSFRARRASQGAIKRRIERRAGHLAFLIVLSAPELACLIGYPLKSTNVPGLARGVARQLPAHPSIPTEGFVIGNSDFPGGERKLAIPIEDRTKHLHLTGQTGVGKSTVIENLIAQEAREGYGLCLIDPNGDLFDAACDLMPRERINNGEVIIFDPVGEEAAPVGLNVLEGDNPYLTTDRILGVFNGLYALDRMPRSYDVAQNSFLLLAMKGLTLMDLPLLLSTSERGKDFRYQQTKGLEGPLKHFWDTFESMKESQQLEWTAPLLHRLSPFNLRPSLRAALGQTKSAFDMNDVLKEGKVLLVNLAKGPLGEATSQLFAALIVSQIWQAAQSRSRIPADQRTMFALHLDEFHNYTALPVSFETVLAEARKYGLAMSLVHQSLGQLTPSMRDAVTTNARSKLLFQAAASDASMLARELSPHLQPDDLANLEKYSAVLRVTGTPPATVATSPPPKRLGTARAARTASRARYGRPIGQVEQELANRHQWAPERRHKPDVGWERPSQ